MAKPGDKFKWHNDNTPRMAARYNNTCQRCDTYANKNLGVIHHKQYTGHDYKKTLDKLIADDAIEWLCKLCHKKAHTATKREEVDLKIKHSGFCTLCKKFSWHAWFKVELGIKYLYGSKNFPLCNGCRDSLLDHKILTWLELPHRKCVYWGDYKHWNKNQWLIFRSLKNKIEREEFGCLSWFDQESSNQGKLF